MIVAGAAVLHNSVGVCRLHESCVRRWCFSSIRIVHISTKPNRHRAAPPRKALFVMATMTRMNLQRRRLSELTGVVRPHDDR